MENLREIVQKIQAGLTPFVWDYLSNFIPKNKLPRDKTGRERLHCFNHKGNGLDEAKDLAFYPETGTFFCHSCRATYNIFTLANLYENKPLEGKEFYTDTVLYLADRYGVNTYGLEDVQIGSQQIKNTSLYNIVSALSNYFVTHSKDNFLKARNITNEAAALFGIGGISDMKDFANFLGQFKREHLRELGILNDDDKINTMLFTDTKLILTLKDVLGNPVGFSSREMVCNLAVAKKILKTTYQFDDTVLNALDKENKLPGIINLNTMDNKHIEFFKRVAKTPKYVNSKTSIIFNKNEMLYGYYENKNKFLTHKTIKVIESPIDVAIAYSKGENNVIACGGTGFTNNHLEFLEIEGKIDKISFMFDNDSAGRNATELAAQKLVDKMKKEKLNKKYYVTEYKTGSLKDIDDNLKIYKEIEDFSYDIKFFNYWLKLEISRKKENEVIDDFIKIISQEEVPLTRYAMIKELFITLDDLAKVNDRVFEFTEDQLTQQLDYYVNKKSEKIQKTIKRLLNKYSKGIDKLKPEDVEQSLNVLKHEVLSEVSASTPKRKSIFDTCKNSFYLDEEEKMTETPKTFECGFDMFDNVSWTGDEMIVLIAKAHTGKTIFMSNITTGYIEKNSKTAVLYISTDDSSRKVNNNFISILTGLEKTYVNEPKNHKTAGLLSNNARAKDFYNEYRKGVRQIGKLIDEKRLTVLQTKEGYHELTNINSAIQEFATSRDLKGYEKLVIIDSANKIKVDDIDDERIKIEFLSKHIKQNLAQTNGVRIIANFEVTKLDSRTRVRKHNIKGSGAIEYDADMIITLSQPLNELSGATSTVWVKPGVSNAQPILVPTIEKSKCYGAKYQSFFYKMDGLNSRLSSVTDEKQLSRIKESWIMDNDKNNKDGYKND